MEFILILFIVVCTATVLSFILNVLCLGIHFYVPMLKKHPSSLLIMYFLSQAIFLTHWIFVYPLEFWYPIYRHLSETTCKIIGSYSVFFYYSCWLSIIFISIEVFIILRYKSYKQAKLRLHLYYASTILLSALIIIFYIYSDSVGISQMQTCFIKMRSPGSLVDMILHLTFCFTLFITYFNIRKQLDCYSAKAFRIISKLVLIVAISAFINRIISLVLYFQVIYDSRASNFCLLLGSLCSILSSVIVALSRILHPKVRRKLMLRLNISESKTSESELLSDEQSLKSIINLPLEISEDLADIFQNLGHRILIQILAVLTLKFQKEKIPKNSLEHLLTNSFGTVIKKHFEKSLYTLLALDFNMPFIHNFYCPKFFLIEYEPKIFALIRKSIEFTTQDMLDSLLSYENIYALIELNNKGGRSESFFFKSRNQKIVIKTITAEERASFLDLLPNYARRVIYNEKSKLIRILGLFQIIPHKQDFIIMENAIKDFSDCLIFDLKGSIVDREVKGLDMSNPPKGVVMKDVNFNQSGIKVKVNGVEDFIKELVNDMRILKKCNIMDYSILLAKNCNGVDLRYRTGDQYSVAIIDFFQKFGTGKLVEGWWKKYALRNQQDISSVPPKQYFKRIKNYLSSVFIEYQENEGEKN